MYSHLVEAQSWHRDALVASVATRLGGFRRCVQARKNRVGTAEAPRSATWGGYHIVPRFPSSLEMKAPVELVFLEISYARWCSETQGKGTRGLCWSWGPHTT